MNYQGRSAVVFWLVLALFGFGAEAGFAAGPVGLAVANGSFRVDDSIVQQTSTLFSGSSVETVNVPALLRFNNGTQFNLGPNSRVRIKGDRLVVEKGSGRIRNARDYAIDVRTLRVAATAPHSIGEVRVPTGEAVTVSAVSGSFSVADAKDRVVATVGSGKALNLVPQPGGAAILTRAIGCLQEDAGRYLLKDEATNLTVELVTVELVDVATGERTTFDLEKEVKKRIEVTGNPSPIAEGAAARAVSTLAVNTLQRLGSCGLPLLGWFARPEALPVIGGAAAATIVCGITCFNGATSPITPALSH